MEVMNLNTASNTELFRLFVEEKDKEAISVFFQNQSDLFYRVALKYTKNSADAEDVVQASFIRIIDKADQYKGLQTSEERLLRSWCLSIIVHCALKKIKSETIRKKNENTYSARNDKPFDEEVNMDTNAEKEKIHKKVKDAIIQLPEKYRIPIHLKYIEGIELEDIANILKLNGNTLRSIIKRGLEKVSDQLKSEKVTLSSVGLIGMIQTMPLEHAPVTIKTMASKMMTTAKSSRRMVNTSSAKFSWASFKGIFLIIASSVAVVAGVYGVKNLEAPLPQAKTSIQPVVAIPKPEPVIAKQKDTNEQWLGDQQYQVKMEFLFGKFEGYSTEFKGLYNEKNRPIFFSFPISTQEKPFVIECTVVPQLKTVNQGIKLMLQGYWVKENIMIENEYWVNDARYTLNTFAPIIQKVYFYNNYVCTFNNGVCYRMVKYKGDLNNVRPAILSRNFVYQKIVSKTLDAPPEELLKGIKELSTQKSSHQADWFARESALVIND